MSSNATPWRRWRDTWRDRRLAGLSDREFCRRVTLEGWEAIAGAAEAGRGLEIEVAGEGLPRTAARALRLFAGARGGGSTYTTPGNGVQRLVAQGERAGRGALVTIAKQGSGLETGSRPSPG